MGSEKNNIEYMLIVVGLLIANFFVFSIIKESENIIDNLKLDSAKNVLQYIQKVNANERDNAERIFEYFNDNATYTKEEVLNNKSLIKEKLSECNLLFTDYNDTYAVFENGDYMISSGDNSSYFNRHDAVLDDEYVKVMNGLGCITLKYQQLDGHSIYSYAYPIYDVNRIPYGILLRTRDLDWICNETNKLNDSDFSFSLIIKDGDGNVAVISDEDGQRTVASNKDINGEAFNLLKNINASYYDKETELTYYVVPKEDTGLYSYKTMARIISLFSLVCFIIIIVLYIKKKNVVRDVRIALIVLLVTSLMYYISFRIVYTKDSLQDNVLKSEIGNALEENVMEMQNVLIDSIDNKIAAVIDSDKVEDISEKYKKIQANIPRNIFYYLNTDKVLLIKESDSVNLINGKIERNSNKNKQYYDYAYYDSEDRTYTIKTDNYVDSEYIITSVITVPQTDEKYVLAIVYNAFILEKNIINDLYSYYDLNEMYIIDIKNNQLYMTPLVNNLDKPGNEFKGEFTMINNLTVKDKVIELINSKEKYLRLITFSNDGSLKNCVLTKTNYLNLVKVIFVGNKQLDLIRIKIIEYVLGLIYVYICLFVIKKIYSNYIKNKKEVIQLHGNY